MFPSFPGRAFSPRHHLRDREDWSRPREFKFPFVSVETSMEPYPPYDEVVSYHTGHIVVSRQSGGDRTSSTKTYHLHGHVSLHVSSKGVGSFCLSTHLVPSRYATKRGPRATQPTAVRPDSVPPAGGRSRRCLYSRSGSPSRTARQLHKREGVSSMRARSTAATRAY